MSSCTTFHYDRERRGIGLGAAAGSAWHRYLEVDVASSVRGAPLFLDGWTFSKGPLAGQTHGVVLIATSDNNVYAFAEDRLKGGSSVPLWSTNLGAPSSKPGSNIPAPVGVCSTPVIDVEDRRMFVLALQDNGSGIGIFRMFSLDVDTGAVRAAAPIHDKGHKGRPTFDGNTLDQRGGLNLVRGHVLATFADYLGFDAGPYHGWVVSCKADDLDDQWFFPSTRGVLGGGCWGPGGAAASADGSLFVATGNATTADATYWSGLPAHAHPGDLGDYFEGVVRLELDRDGGREHFRVTDWYQPANAQWLNDADLDFGSSSPMVLPRIGGRDLVVIPAKFDTYLLDRDRLGHWGGELWFANLFTGESHSAPAYYPTPAGDHYVYLVGAGSVPGTSSPGLTALRVSTAGGASLQHVWNAKSTTSSFGDAPGSPVVAVVDSPPYALVWVVNAGDGTDPVLLAFDALTGNQVFSSGTVPSDALPVGPPYLHYPALTCAGTSIFVGTRIGFSCYGV